MRHVKGFRCINCGKEESLRYSGMICPSCGENMDVIYDYSYISRKITPRKLAQQRDIGKYRPLLPLKKNTPLTPLRVGDTPLYKAGKLSALFGNGRLYLKDETHEPSASFKDRAGFLALAKAQESKSEIIAGASTGNAASSLAALAASVGQRVKIFVPHTAPVAKITQLLIYGAEVYLVHGSYDEAFDLCTKACAKYGWLNRNTGYNPFTREGKKTCSYEIAEQLNWTSPTRVYVPTGDGNIISGMFKGFYDMYKLGWIKRIPKMVSVQSNKSAAIANAFKNKTKIKPVKATTIADSISVDYPRDGLAALNALYNSNGYAVTVSDSEILSAINILGQKTGIFVEPAAATAYAGWLKDISGIKNFSRETHIAVLTGNGLKDIQSAIRAAKNKPKKISTDFKKFTP